MLCEPFQLYSPCLRPRIVPLLLTNTGTAFVLPPPSSSFLHPNKLRRFALVAHSRVACHVGLLVEIEINTRTNRLPNSAAFWITVCCVILLHFSLLIVDDRAQATVCECTPGTQFVVKRLLALVVDINIAAGTIAVLCNWKIHNLLLKP